VFGVPKVVLTGIESFDVLVGGGFPRGSVVLLTGDFEAGQEEFLITSAERLAALRERRARSRGNVFIPGETIWMTMMRHGADLLQSVSTRFHPDFYKRFSKGVKFEDFFEEYVKESPSLPREIMNEVIANDRKSKKPARDLEEIVKRAMSPGSLLLDSLTRTFRQKAPGNMMVLDSLTDLVRIFKKSPDDWNSLILFLHWIKRSSKNWGGITYMLFTRGVLEKALENELLTCFSDIIVFKSGGTSQGEYRTLSIKKFSGGFTERSEDVKIKITSRGLEVEKLRLIRRLT